MHVLTSVDVPNLAMVETVSSLRMASLLDKAWEKVSNKPLDILIQVNTSNEERMCTIVRLDGNFRERWC